MDEFPAYGTRVRFTAAQLGTIDPTQPGAKFREEVVNAGDEGEVVTAEGQMPEGWVAIKPDKFPALLVPVQPSMIEPLRSQVRE
jgi:hypothetical protein